MMQYLKKDCFAIFFYLCVKKCKNGEKYIEKHIVKMYNKLKDNIWRQLNGKDGGNI